MKDLTTLLPFPNFRETARVLNKKHLGVMRMNAYEIARIALIRDEEDPEYVKKEDPAVEMWRGYGFALVAYACAMCDEYVARGFNDGIKAKLLVMVSEVVGMSPDALEGVAHQDALEAESLAPNHPLPSWLGDEELHSAHRSILLRWDRVWYGQYGWQESPLTESKVKKVAKKTEEEGAPAESGSDNLNRGGIVDALRVAGYDGPTSYTKTRLLEMLATVQGGGTIDIPKRGRRREGEQESSPAA